MKKEYEKLFLEAKKARENAYAIYSNFKVGASILLKDGNIISGFNIENSSYSLCNCAERNAMYRAYMEGYNKDDIITLLVLADTNTPCSPCGACRQVMAELLNPSTLVLLANLKGEIKEVCVSELLPYAFSKEDLGK